MNNGPQVTYRGPRLSDHVIHQGDNISPTNWTQIYELGINISYDRVLVVENEISTAVSENTEMKDAVCPVQLRQDVFTVEALHSLDFNPSRSTTKVPSMEQASVSSICRLH